jgi:FkbM family methyltransferase
MIPPMPRERTLLMMSIVDLPRKAIRRVREYGPSLAFRKAIWKFYFERFERLRSRHAERPAHRPSVVRFLDKEFELHQSLRGLNEEMLLFGTHEPLGTRVYLEQLAPGDHVLDVGSNIGYFLLLASRQVGSSGRVLGFEPAPDVYEILLRNVERSGQKNVQVLPWAVGAKTETAYFYHSDVPNWGSLIHDPQLVPSGSTTVQVRSLDGILEQFPDFHPKALRMDLEGGELMVLEGAKRVLKRFKPRLFIEFHPNTVGWLAVRSALTGLVNVGYSSGFMIDRTWDHPWMGRWMRERQCWRGSIETLIKQVESPRNRLQEKTLSFILS